MRERERESEHGGGAERERERERQRQRERERLPSRLCTVSTEPDVGVESTNCKIMTEPKPRVRYSIG